MNFKIKHQTVKFTIIFFIALIFSFSNVISATNYWNGDVYSIEMPGGGQSDYLLKARYTIFIPKGVSKIKGILIHQHGCGAEGWGEPMATDAQYQAFAKKWSFAILGPDLYPKTGRNCFDWTNPLEGSGQSLITGLEILANQSGHTELTTIPWLLWGHSGGGCWVLRMLKEYPKRIIGVFAYSPGLKINYDFPDEAAKVPVMIRHAGTNDFNAPGIDCWGTSLTVFSKLRNMNGLASIAYNANQNHNFSFVRLMAIPFFESVVAQRLPGKGEPELREMDQNKSWLVDTITNGEPKIYKVSNFFYGLTMALLILRKERCGPNSNTPDTPLLPSWECNFYYDAAIIMSFLAGLSGVGEEIIEFVLNYIIFPIWDYIANQLFNCGPDFLGSKGFLYPWNEYWFGASPKAKRLNNFYNWRSSILELKGEVKLRKKDSPWNDSETY